MVSADYAYVGGELDVFALATNWKRYFSHLLRPHVRGRVLEVGAGIGTTAQSLWNPTVTEWTCLEPDATLAQRLSGVTLGPGSGVRPEIIVGDVSAVAPTRRFDAITYIDVLEHIEDDTGELARSARLLAPGGSLIVLSPAFPSLHSEFDRAIGHVRRYTAGTLQAAFPRTLRRERVYYADAVGMALSLANRVLLRQSLPTRSQILTWDRFVVPLSRMVDPLMGRAFGRSVIAVYVKPKEMAAGQEQGSVPHARSAIT
jgi:ubiquinone/menaquinone biosynthesis C-methylase UbiE